MNLSSSFRSGASTAVILLITALTLNAQYTPNPRDYAAHRFLMDDGTGNGFYGIIRLSGVLTNHIYYDFPTNASGAFIFSNSVGGQTITGGLTVDLLTLGTPLAATSGGTGFGSYALGDLLYANSTTSLARLPIGTNGQILTISGGLPIWSNTASGLQLPFSQLTNGTNTGQSALEVGNGSSLYPVGTGAITANRFVATGSSTDAVDLATGEVSGVLPDGNVSNTLTITGGSIDGTPIGSTTASSGRFTTITGTSLPGGSVSTTFVMSNGGALETRTAGSLTGIVGVSTNGTLTGDGTSGTPLGINLGSANTWTATQTLPTTAGQGDALIGSTNAGTATINAARIGNGLTNTQVNDNLTISGGTVDNTPVGATTASTGRFTTITGTTLPSGSSSTAIVTSNGGALETRTAGSLAGTIGVSTNGTLTGDGTSGTPLGVNLASANTWTATQTLPATAAQGDALIASTNAGSNTINAARIGNGLTNTQVNDDLTISGGTVDNTPVGATTRSSGAFTSLSGNGLVTLGDGNDNITLNAGSGIISMSGDKLENVADPTAAQDAATKNYVDNQITSAAWVLGGNTSPSSNIFGTLSATDVDVRTNNTTRMTVGSGGGIGINATPVSTTKLGVGTVAATGGIGVAVDMTGTTTSTGVKITNVGATGSNDAGLAISSSAGGTGTGIRLGGGAGNNLGTGINITGGTGITYNAASAGSGTGISVGGTTRPATGGNFEASTVAVQAQSGATGNGVIASTATTPVAPPTGIALAGYSQNNTGNTTSRGVYGEAASTGNGASTTTYGAVGIANNTGGTNSGLSVGLFGTAAGAGSGTNAVVGGFFQTTGATGNRFAIVANGGGDVYLGSSDADRPAALTAGSYIGSGNTNTTYMNAIRSSGTAGTANVRMGSLSGAALTGTYTPTANDGIIVADNNGDLLKRSVSSVLASSGVQYNVSSTQATATPRTNHLFDVAYSAAAADAAATGARITSSAGAAGNNNATALTLVAAPTGTGTATALNATGNVLLGNTGTASELRLAEPSAGGSDYTALKAQAQTNNITYTLPSANGTDGQVLRLATGATATAGTLEWATLTSGWGLTGNGGLTDGTNNFFGTTNAIPVRFITSNAERMRLTSTGVLGIGTTTPNANTVMELNRTSATLNTGGTFFAQRIDYSSQGIGPVIHLYGLYADVYGTDDSAVGLHVIARGGNNVAGRFVATNGGLGIHVAQGNVLLSNTGTASELRFAEPSGSGTDYTSFMAQAQANNITYTLPSSTGSAGQVLQLASSPAPTASTATLTWGNGTAWTLTGNGGTNPTTNFLGTTDNQAFEIRVDNGGTATEGRRRVMRFEPNASSANIIGGFNGNSVTSGAVGATIAGGGLTSAINSVTDDYGVVSGGQNNRAGDNAGTVSDATYATVAGGISNVASGVMATISGGSTNTSSSTATTVSGGQSNSASGIFSAIAGGSTNSVAGDYGAILGGRGLTLTAAADRSFGFHANNSGGTRNMTIAASDVAVFGNTDVWLANNDNAPSELRFFEAYNASGTFPNTANYSAFKAQDQSNDITYTLPSTNGTAGQVLRIASSPAPTSTAATLEWGGDGNSVQYNVNSTQASATPRTNHLFDVAYDATAPDAAATGARITSSAGAAGNNNATALTLVATPTGTGVGTALDATGNVAVSEGSLLSVGNGGNFIQNGSFAVTPYSQAIRNTITDFSDPTGVNVQRFSNLSLSPTADHFVIAQDVRNIDLSLAAGAAIGSPGNGGLYPSVILVTDDASAATSSVEEIGVHTIDFTITNTSSTAYNTVSGIRYYQSIEGGTVSDAYGVEVTMNASGPGLVTNAEGISIGSVDADNAVGLRISSVNGFTSSYAIRSDATAPSFFDGNIGIGQLTPSEKLEVRNGNILLSNVGGPGELRFQEPFATGTDYTAFKAQTQANSITYTLPAAITGTVTDERFLRSTTTTANTEAALDWVDASTLVGAAGVLYNVNSTQATANPRTNRLFDIAYSAAAPDATAVGARIISSAGPFGNTNATALTLVALTTGTGTATALDATGNVNMSEGSLLKIGSGGSTVTGGGMPIPTTPYSEQISNTFTNFATPTDINLQRLTNASFSPTVDHTLMAQEVRNLDLRFAGGITVGSGTPGGVFANVTLVNDQNSGAAAVNTLSLDEINFASANTSSTTYNEIMGSNVSIDMNGANAVEALGFNTNLNVQSPAAITGTAYGMQINVNGSSAGNIANAKGIAMYVAGDDATGLHITGMVGHNGPSNTYAIRSETSAKSYFGGFLGLGIMDPTDKLEVTDGNIKLSNNGIAGQVKFYEPFASGINYTAFQAQAQTDDITYTLPAAITSSPGDQRFLRSTTTVANSAADLDWVDASAIIASGGVQYNVSSTQATATPRTNHLFDVAYSSGAADALATGARITSSAGLLGNDNATALTLVANATGTGTATALNATGNIVLATASSQINNTAGDVTIDDNLVVTGTVSSTPGVLQLNDDVTVTGSLLANGGVSLGDAAGDVINLTGTLIGLGNSHSLGTIGTNATVITIQGLAGGASEFVVAGDAEVNGALSAQSLNLSGTLNMGTNDIINLGDVIFNTAASNISNSSGDVQIADNLVVNTAAGTDLTITETGVDRNSGATETFSVDNSGAGDVSLLVNGATSVANSRIVINNGHWTSQGAAPTAAGDGTNLVAAVTVSGTATDVAGKVTATDGGIIGTGVITVTFVSPYATDPVVVVTPGNATTAGTSFYVSNITTTSFDINIAATVGNGTSTYIFYYQVIEND